MKEIEFDCRNVPYDVWGLASDSYYSNHQAQLHWEFFHGSFAVTSETWDIRFDIGQALREEAR